MKKLMVLAIAAVSVMSLHAQQFSDFFSPHPQEPVDQHWSLLCCHWREAQLQAGLHQVLRRFLARIQC